MQEVLHGHGRREGMEALASDLADHTEQLNKTLAQPSPDLLFELFTARVREALRRFFAAKPWVTPMPQAAPEAGQQVEG